jgi:hypothetical protein
MRMANKAAVMPPNANSVCIKSLRAWGFLPSKYRTKGWYRNKYPIIAAEKVKREMNTMGAKRESCPILNTLPQ